MAIQDDGDLIKGMGYLAIYAGYFEESIDNLISTLKSIDSGLCTGNRWPLGKKITFCEGALKIRPGNEEVVTNLLADLSVSREVISDRNNLIHGRIYGSLDGVSEILKSGDISIKDTKISSEDLYELANELMEFSNAINSSCLYLTHCETE